MRCPRLTPRRYQLKKEAVRSLEAGHPWVFRGGLSSAAQVFSEGQWLRLVDGQNRVLGYGIYQDEGVVAIRSLRPGPEPPDLDFLRERVNSALARREGLLRETEAVRLVNGESDGLPGVTLDRYGPVAVLQTYSPGVDNLGRWVAATARSRLGLSGVLFKPPRRRSGSRAQDSGLPGPAARQGAPSRILYGSVPDELAFREGPLTLWARPGAGQKSGTFLDLRGLRRWLLSRNLAGQRVLNLFSYTGALGLACEAAGAEHVSNLDGSQSALEFGALRHCRDRQRQSYQAADLFGPWEEVPAGPFDLILVDPPLMTSRMDQVGRALGVYRRLYKRCRSRLAPQGTLVACCCTARISYDLLRKTLDQVLEMPMKRRLPPEPDHRPGFPEADYLKVLIYTTRAT